MSSTATKKTKGKKVADPNETSKLLAAKINQLEQDANGEKEQEAEIEREVKKATRDLNQLLSTMDTPMLRLEFVSKKYTELFTDMKKLDRDYNKMKKRADQLQKDNEKAKSELGKSVTMKDKLEKLCRELTKENKKLKDENKKLEETEKKARVTVNERLDSLLVDAQDVMSIKATSSSKIDIDLDDAVCMKIKTICDAFEMRDIYFKSILRHRDLEHQSLACKYEETRRIAEQEAGRVKNLSQQVSTFSHTEAELRSQLNIYVEKFKQVEDTLNNSNELFLTFRKEMEDMSKKTKRLEKENQNLNRKHESTNRNILEMAEERTRNQDEMERLRRKCHHLEDLCRRMQAQGRGQSLSQADGHLDHDHDHDHDDEGTESEYDDEFEDDEELSEEGELDEHDHVSHTAAPSTSNAAVASERPVFGPPPPPSILEARASKSGVVNGCH